eukprot:TRINITY_DN2197_c1_g3_i2.p1 TRINITY_DN2197_c1_g3~~TRINITY_DN2197_c1_g3_i2.p1  ORF type:complete len:221 (+),score=23.38 TRINITY_DN2197_c1_g3_i2:165-827(+)
MARTNFGRTLLQHLNNTQKPLSETLFGSRVGSRDIPWNPRIGGVRFLAQKIECILTQNVPKIGKTGEVVEVAPGYLRNFLMPKLMALPNLPHYAFVARQKKEIEKDSKGLMEKETQRESAERDMVEYKKAVRRLDRALVGIRRLVLGKGDELCKPVTKEDIIAEVERQLYVIIYPENMVMPSDITQAGLHEIPLRFPSVIPLPEGKKQIALKIKIVRKFS